MKNGFKDFCNQLELSYEYSRLEEIVGRESIDEIINASVVAENCDQKHRENLTSLIDKKVQILDRYAKLSIY